MNLSVRPKHGGRNYNQEQLVDSLKTNVACRADRSLIAVASIMGIWMSRCVGLILPFARPPLENWRTNLSPRRLFSYFGDREARILVLGLVRTVIRMVVTHASMIATFHAGQRWKNYDSVPSASRGSGLDDSQ